MSNRRLFIAGNWKMNLNILDSTQLAMELHRATKEYRQFDIAVAPTSLAISSVVSTLKESGIHVAGQNIHSQTNGAFTGEISGEMLRHAGCAYVLIGHSERRTLFGDTLEFVAEKVKAAYNSGLLPILCVGETLEEREQGKAQSIVEQQLLTALEGLATEQVAAITIAYEPVWAIGTGKTATPEEAQQMHSYIRTLLRSHFAPYVAEEVRIQYGGSVKAQNAKELLSQPDIDGALVGGASLTCEGFVGILEALSN